MSDETALSTVSQSEAALAALGIDEAEPLKPCRLELIQPISSANEPGLVAGRFRDVQSGIQYESLNVVPLTIRNGRVLFPPGEDLGAKPICRSNDGLFPIISQDLVRQDGGLGCHKCSKSQFRRIGGKLIRSECSDTRSVLFAELETQFIFRLNAKRTQNTPINEWRETIKKIIRTAKSKGQTIYPYGLTFKLSSIRLEKGGKKYFVPKFVATGQVHPDDLPLFANIFNYFSTPREDEEGTSCATKDPVSSVVEAEYVDDTPEQFEEA